MSPIIPSLTRVAGLFLMGSMKAYWILLLAGFSLLSGQEPAGDAAPPNLDTLLAEHENRPAAEVLETAREQLARTEGRADRTRLVWLSFASWASLRNGDLEGGIAHAEQGRALAERIGDKPALARLLNGLGALNHVLGEHDRASSYYRSSLTLRQEIGDRQGASDTLFNLASLELDRGALDAAIARLREAESLKRALGDDSGLVDVLASFGNILKRRGRYGDALTYHREALELARALDRRQRIAFSLSDIGYVYFRLGDYDLALENHLQSLQIKEDLGDTSGIAASLEGVGDVYSALGRHDEAMGAYQRSLALEEELGNDQRIAFSLVNLGNAQRALGNLESARETYLRAIDLEENAGREPESRALLNLGEVLLARARFVEARRYLMWARRQYEAQGEVPGMAEVDLRLASLLRLTGEPVRALAAADAVLATARELGEKALIREAHLERSASLEAQGLHAEALAAFKLHKAVSDEIFDEGNSERFARLRTRYEAEKREKEILLLRQENAAKERESKARDKEIALLRAQARIDRLNRYFILAGAACLVLLAILWLSRRNQRALLAAERAHAAGLEATVVGRTRDLREKNEELARARDDLRDKARELAELDELKTRFFTNVSHELRTPLTLILGPLETVIDAGVPDDQKRRLEQIRGNANRLLGTVNELLDISKLEAGKMMPRPERRDLVGFLRTCVAFFEPQAESKGVDLETNLLDGSVTAVIDPDKLEKAICNLVANGLQHTPSPGRVTISLEETDAERVRIAISDSGQGIPAEELAHVFDRFYRGRSAADGSVGSGIGLALTREVIHLHGGEITAASEPGQGAAFTIVLPRFHLTEESGPEPTPVASAGPAPPISTDVTVLLVEDDGEMRAFISEHLGKHYHLLVATDGNEALTLAREEVPDLVITDVMMPGMDGFALCGALEEDARTSHVPVLMLTARASDQARLEGLSRGADAYMTKPFLPRELVLQAESLIKTHQSMRRHYQKLMLGGPEEEMTTASVEEQFLAKLRDILDQHLGDPDFGVDALAEEMAFSPRQLRRKLKALTDRGPAELLRTARLQRAERLLRERAGNVAEICYAVGFRNPRHFADLFRQEYGRNPSSLLE